MFYVLPLIFACSAVDGTNPKERDADEEHVIRNLSLLVAPAPTFGDTRDLRLAGCVLTVTSEAAGSTWEYDERGRLTAYDGSIDEEDGSLTVGSGTKEWSDDDCLDLETYVRADSAGSVTYEYVRTCDESGNTETYAFFRDGELQKEETRTNTYNDDGWLIGGESVVNDLANGQEFLLHMSASYDDGWVSEIANVYASLEDVADTSRTTTYRTRGDVLERLEVVTCTLRGDEECEDEGYAKYTFNGADEAIAAEGFLKELDLGINGITVESESTWTGAIVPSEDGWPAEATFITDGADPIHRSYSVECANRPGGF